jgi:hypothetical protein
MPADPTWTCGCGTSVTAAEGCPTCGWASGAPGQPDRSHRRWVPLVSAVLVGTLAVDGVVALRGLGEVTAHRLEDDRESTAFVPVDVLDELDPRTVPEDLGTLLPAELAGWERIEAPDLTGPLTLDELTAGTWEGDDLAAARDNLRAIGFSRAHAVAFVSGERVLGATLWEFATPSGAREQLRDQETLAAIDDSVETVDVALADDAVAFTYEEEGSTVFEIWYRVDQLIVNEYLLATGPVGEADLQLLHAAVAERVGP